MIETGLVTFLHVQVMRIGKEKTRKGVTMVASSNPYKCHSIAEAFASIIWGEDPWFALGCFLHDWWCNAVNARADLIAEPPMPGTTLEEKR